MTVVNGRLIVLLTHSGFFRPTNSLFAFDGDHYERIDTFRGHYMILGGGSTIHISKIKSGFLNNLYEGATLYTIDLDGKWKMQQKYVDTPYYAYVDDQLLYGACGERHILKQWNNANNSFDVVLTDIDRASFETHDTLVRITKPSQAASDYSFWIPSKRKVVNMFCGKGQIIKDFIYADDVIYWSNSNGIYQFNTETNSLDVVVVFSQGDQGNDYTYFYMNGSKIYYIDDGFLNMYDVINKAQKSWNCCPANPEGFVIVNNIMYSCTSLAQIQYTFLSDDLKCGSISIE